MQRVRRRLTNCGTCSICHNDDETLLHLFRDCPKAQTIWRSINKPVSIQNSFLLDWNGWIAAQMHCSTVVYGGIKWCNLFVFTCWHIWKWRNKQIFDPHFPMPLDPKQIIIQAADEWKYAQAKASSSSVYNTVMLA